MMFKTMIHFMAGALIAAAVGAAMATVGTAPVPSTGFGLVDGTWLNGLAGGSNYSYQSGISAAGTTQAGATTMPANISLVEIDTVPASSGVALPPCIPGVQITVYNATATNVIIYPSIANNPLTAAQDTINASTSFTLNAHTSTSPSCAKAGVWGTG